MRSEILVYLSGPITATALRSTESHVANAVDEFHRCIRAGLPTLCPHLGAIYPSAYAIAYETWIEYDLILVGLASHLLMLHGWQDSKGARREWLEATRLGKPIAYSLEQLTTMVNEASHPKGDIHGYGAGV